MHFLFGQIAGFFSFLGYSAYIISIFKGDTKPNRATWWIWTVVGIIIATSYYASGATATIWVPISNAIGPLFIAIVSLKYGVGGWDRFDKYCLLGALSGLVLWWLFQTALVALLVNVFIDFMGALPTLKKVHKNPRGENIPAWVLFSMANTLNLFAINIWKFAIIIYPVYLFFCSGTILVTLILRYQKVHKTQKVHEHSSSG